MPASRDPEPFPCPFCDCVEILLIGGTATYLYYRCLECAEAWTSLVDPPPPPRPELRPTIH